MFLTQIFWWFSTQGSFLEWCTAIGTVVASASAVYFGAIRPNTQRAEFKIHNPTNTTSHFTHAVELVGTEGDIVETGFLVEQISGAPTKNVNVLVKKIWYWPNGEEKSKVAWPYFVPSNLRWAAKDSNFAKGVQRYCYLGAYGDPPSNNFVNAVFNISTSENTGDPMFDAFSPMLPDSQKYEIELLISGENVKEKEFKINLKLIDIRTLGPLGEDGEPVGGNQIGAVRAEVQN